MKIDIREHGELAGLVVAFLDGVPLNGVVMADEGSGQIMRYYQDEDGVFWPEMPLQLLSGNVEIKPGKLDDLGQFAFHARSGVKE